jgi:hypothetical protein
MGYGSSDEIQPRLARLCLYLDPPIWALPPGDGFIGPPLPCLPRPFRASALGAPLDGGVTFTVE